MKRQRIIIYWEFTIDILGPGFKNIPKRRKRSPSPTLAVLVVLRSPVTLVAGQNASPSGESDKSLGDIARQVHPKDAKIISQRVFTDEDVKHGSQPPLPNQAKTAADNRKKTEAYLQDAEKYADNLSAKTPRQLGEIVAKNIQFPGRDTWEKQLAESRDALVTATQTAAFSVRNAQTLSEGSGSRCFPYQLD